MIRKSGNRFSEEIMLKQRENARVWFNRVESDSSGGGQDEEADQRRRNCDERKSCRILCGAFRYRAYGRACAVRAAPASHPRQGSSGVGWGLRTRAASHRIRRARNAGCRMSRSGFHLADARSHSCRGRGRGRRGVAGTLIVEKILGAAAEEGRSLAALKALGDRANAATRSIGIALTSCTVPAAGKPTFDIAEDEMEVGVGIHGEPGRRRVKLKPAAGIAAEVVNAITTGLGGRGRGEVILLINGFGATPLSELYLMYDAVRRLLEAAGMIVTRSLVGNFVTSLDMAGCSATVSILDEEMKRLWDAPLHTAALRWGM